MANKKVQLQTIDPISGIPIEDVDVKTSASCVSFADGTTFEQKLQSGELKGEKGDQGLKGESGIAATVKIGSVTSGTTPSISNVGTSTNATFNFVLPKGDKGEKGDRGIQGEKGEKGENGDEIKLGTSISNAQTVKLFFKVVE